MALGLALGLGAPWGGGGVRPIDPHTLGNRIFEIRSHDISKIYGSAVGPTPVVADGDTVEAWQDEGVDGTRSPLQLTASLKPKYKTDISNGKSAILFETDDRMTLAAAIDNAEFVDCTVYCVSIPAGGSNQTIISSATTNDACQLRFTSANIPQVLENTVALVSAANTGVSTTVPSTIAFDYDGATLNHWKQIGVSDGSTVVARTFTNDVTALCHSITLEMFQGYLFYVAVFTEIHDTATRKGVMSYLSTFYGAA